MRLKERFISREAVMGTHETYEIIERYPEDKYLPSYLVFAQHEGQALHVQIAADRENENIRIVTAYKPSQDEWEEDFKTRRKK